MRRRDRTRFSMVSFAPAIAGLLWMGPAEALAVRLEAAPAGSQIIVEGTSTLHDWHVTTETVHGFVEVEMTPAAPGEALHVEALRAENGLTDLSVTVPVDSLKSGKKGMDKIMHDALRRKQHADITFTLTDAQPGAQDQGAALTLTGDLTVAGQTQQVEVVVQIEATEDGGLLMVGEQTLRMTDFNIEPPTAMLGVIRTGDEVKVRFSWALGAPSDNE